MPYRHSHTQTPSQTEYIYSKHQVSLTEKTKKKSVRLEKLVHLIIIQLSVPLSYNCTILKECRSVSYTHLKYECSTCMYPHSVRQVYIHVRDLCVQVVGRNYTRWTMDFSYVHVKNSCSTQTVQDLRQKRDYLHSFEIVQLYESGSLSYMIIRCTTFPKGQISSSFNR